MITVVRVEAVGDSPGQLKTELDAITAHIARVGMLEGLAWRSYEIPDEVYPRRRPDDVLQLDGHRFEFEFEGRKVLRFVPDDPFGTLPYRQSQDEQFEFAVTRGVLGHDRDATEDVIVLERQIPLGWPLCETGELVAGPAKPTKEDFELFMAFALLEQVDRASYREVDGGFVIEYGALLSQSTIEPANAGNGGASVSTATTGAAMSLGWPGSVFGETLGAAAKAAVAEVGARAAEYGVTVRTDG